MSIPSLRLSAWLLAAVVPAAVLAFVISPIRARAIQSAAGTPVEGRVLTPGGKPVKGAAIYWMETSYHIMNPSDADHMHRRFVVETDAQGRFRFAEAVPGPDEKRYVTLLMRSDDWGLTLAGLPAPGKPITITALPPVSLRVRFTDEAGKPLSRIPVRISALVTGSWLQFPPDMHGRWEQTTNVAGECRFFDLPQGGTVYFAPSGDAFALPGMEDAVTLGKSDIQQERPIQLHPGGSVAGRVIGVDGKPVAGMEVAAQCTGNVPWWGQAVTDARGDYRISGLRPGGYNIAPFLEDPENPGTELIPSFTARAVEQAIVKAGVTLAGQNITLIPGSFVTGRVTDGKTGKPVAGVSIGIYGPAHPQSSGWVQSATTSADGAYRLRVPSGKQYVYVMGLPDGNRYERPEQGVDVPVGESATATHDFALTPIPSKNLQPIRGRAMSEDGKPLPHAKISYAPVTGSPFPLTGGGEVESDATGAFTIPMSSSAVTVRACKGDMATVTATLAQGGEEIALRLQPNALVSVRGRATDATGKPLMGADAELIVWGANTGLGSSKAVTDADGKFSFTGLFPDSQYSIDVNGTKVGYGAQQTGTAKYSPGEKADVGTLRLPRADKTVAGRVVDENGDPIQGKVVGLSGDASPYQETVSDKQGRFQFQNVVDERVLVTVADERRLSPDESRSFEKRVEAGNRDVIIVWRSPGATPPDADAATEQAAQRRRSALLSHAGSPLNAAAWLNARGVMPQGLKGKIVLIDFWSVSCGPCVAALPAVQQAYEQLGPRGVVFVGLHASGITQDELASFLRAHKLTYPIAIDTADPAGKTFGQVMSSYGVIGIPMVAVLDRKGVVRYLGDSFDGAVKTVTDLLAAGE